MGCDSHTVTIMRNPEQNAISTTCNRCGDTVTVLVNNRPPGDPRRIG